MNTDRWCRFFNHLRWNASKVSNSRITLFSNVPVEVWAALDCQDLCRPESKLVSEEVRILVPSRPSFSMHHEGFNLYGDNDEFWTNGDDIVYFVQIGSSRASKGLDGEKPTGFSGSGWQIGGVSICRECDCLVPMSRGCDQTMCFKCGGYDVGYDVGKDHYNRIGHAWCDAWEGQS